MTQEEMIEEFICPGCVNGSDIKCGSYKPEPGSVYGKCENHVLGTMELSIGNFALGLPKGFNRPGWCMMRERTESKMAIRTWTETQIDFLCNEIWDNLNIPVWFLEKPPYVFVRTYSPRINQGFVDILHEDPKIPTDLRKMFEKFNTLNVQTFYNDID